MDFDQLHTFLEIVRLKSFSKAAQTCYRTQPAISAQIRQLEHELKAELFERFGSRISLTTAGKIFSEYAERMLDLRRQAQNALNELESSPRGELVIAANEATCIYVLPAVFAEYKTQFPGVQLQVNRSYGSRVVEAVMENVADFGLTQLPVLEKRVQIVDIGVPSSGDAGERDLRRHHPLSASFAADRHDAKPPEHVVRKRGG
jgi:DNA-binding transcriptional LysR family regulator